MARLMRTVAVESPLKGDFVRNRRYALWCGYDCYRRGEAPLILHIHYPQFLNDLDPEHREFGITAGYAWTHHADLHAFYQDIGISDGMWRRHRHFDAHDPRVVFRNLPEDLMQAFERGEYPRSTLGFVTVVVSP